MLSSIELIVLDSSHLIGVTSDWVSKDRARMRSAAQFIPKLVERGKIPLMSWHQIEELMQHEDENLVDMRLKYLRTWPHAAWVSGEGPKAVPGGVLRILNAELVTAYSEPGLPLLSVRDIVRDKLLTYGTGEDMISEGQLRDWRELRPALTELQDHARKVTAISRFRAGDFDNTRVGDWANKPLRSVEAKDEMLLRLAKRLTDEISTRGDKRIRSPQEVATSFMSDMGERGRFLHEKALDVSPAIALLLDAGLEPDDLNPSMTFAEALELLDFKTRLKTLCEFAGLPWRDVQSVVTRDRLPGTLIAESIRKFGQDQPERKGSDLNDINILCLAPYANCTYVDKRTLENVRRIKKKVPSLELLLGDVRKATGYKNIDAGLTAE